MDLRDPRNKDEDRASPVPQFDSARDAVTRREFLEIAAASSLLASFPAYAHSEETKGEVPRRTLGRTGEQVSAIGLGGFHLGKPELQESEAVQIIRKGLDSGINFLDNCWDYNGGESEIRMGKALRDGYRQKAFLMTKIDGARPENRGAAARRIPSQTTDGPPRSGAISRNYPHE